MRWNTVYHVIYYFSSLTRPRFSVNGWLHTSGNTSVPVVVEARPQNAGDLTGGMIHSYSFLDFFFNDPEFEVQNNVWCRGAVNPPPLPKLPRRFDVDLEHVNSDDSTRIWAARVSREVYSSTREWLFFTQFNNIYIRRLHQGFPENVKCIEGTVLEVDGSSKGAKGDVCGTPTEKHWDFRLWKVHFGGFWRWFCYG